MKTEFFGLSGIKLDLLNLQNLGDCSGKKTAKQSNGIRFSASRLEVGRDGLNYCYVCDYSIKTKVLSLRPHSLFGKPRDQQLECEREEATVNPKVI